ncbi:MAG: desampylase [Haloplanus sp.]
MTSSESLRLTAAVRASLLAHAREGRDPPREVCGVLAGERGPPDRVTGTRRVPNAAADQRTRYELDPEAAVAAVDAVESGGDEVVGFYHSHPESAPVPSDTDRAQATWPGYVYLIVAPHAAEIRAYRWTGEAFDRLDVHVESAE